MMNKPRSGAASKPPTKHAADEHYSVARIHANLWAVVEDSSSRVVTQYYGPEAETKALAVADELNKAE